MAAFSKVNAWAENMVEVANLATDVFKVALTNTAPTAAGTSVLADVTEIAYTNLSSRTLTTTASTQTGGVFSLSFSDLVLTSSGGSTGPFRYVVIFDDTPTSPADPVVCYLDYGSALTLNDTETLTLDFGTNLFTLT